MRWLGLGAAAVAAVTIGVAAATGAFGGNSQPALAAEAPPPPDAIELDSIRQLVVQTAAAMGDAAPTNGVLVPTTRRLAELVDVDTDEPDTPVYFVLVHGEFTDYGARRPKGAKPPTGTILTLTIDPGTNRSLDTGLVGAMPDVNAMGEPEPLPLGGDPAQLSKQAPCAGRRQRPTGPGAVRRFRAVTAVSCVERTRTCPGHGRWWVRIRRVAVSSVAALQRYFQQPDAPDLPKGGFCDDVAHLVLVPTFVDGSGHWLVPRVPTDGCGEPLPGHGRLTRAVRWHVVSVHRERRLSARCHRAGAACQGGGRAILHTR